MEEQKVLKIFKNFIGGIVDLHGLRCEPVKVDLHGSSYITKNPKYFIRFQIDNTNDVSYYYSIVEDELREITYEFGDFLNIKFEPLVNFEEGKKLYLSDELRSKIQEVFNSVRVIEFSEDNEEYRIYVQSIGIGTSYFDEESFRLLNKVTPLKAEKNGETVNVLDAITVYEEYFLPKRQSYWETENLYMEIDQMLTDYPLLSAEYVATYYDTKFII